MRLYVELDKLSETERISDRALSEADIISKAQKHFLLSAGSQRSCLVVHI